MTRHDVLIVGAGHAGAQAAIALRQLEFEGSIALFWSNRYDLRLQTVGLSLGHDATVLRGDPAARSFSLVYLRGGRVIALDCVNAARDYAQGRKLVEAGAEVAPERLADASRSLKELAWG